MKGRIDLKGIEVLARHGVLAEEKTTEQPFVIDVSVETDFGPAAASDELEDTLDYGAVAQKVHDLVRSESHQLIEKLADRVATEVLEDETVLSVTVTVHKPEAPIDVPFGDVAVTITKSR